MWQRLTIFFLFLPIFAAVFPREVAAQELSDGEPEFVLQLRRRGLTELAETHCRQQLAASTSAQLKTRWQLMLTDCHEDHLWSVSSAQRADYVTMAASQITDFIREHKPGRNEDVELQVRQIEFLCVAARIECLQASPIVSDPDRTYAVRVTSHVEFGREVCRQARELLTILQKQIEQYRKELDQDVVRVARYRLRCAEADLLLSQILLGAVPADSLAELQTQGEQLLRSSGEPDRFRVRRMMAEVMLASRDFVAFELRQKNAAAEARTSDERLSALTLQMQAMLLQGQPSEALQLMLDAPAELEIMLSPEVQVLKLQALLQLNELLHQLTDDTKERRDSLQKTVDEFLPLQRRLQSQLTGVWADRARRIGQRFDSVQKVGPDGATAMESITDQMAAGQFKEAHAALIALAAKLPTNSMMAANVQLQAGDLSIKQQEWTTAITELQQAAELFETQKAIDRQSAADLLRIFALGQLWNTQPDKASLDQYRSALDHHIQQFAEQQSVVSAHEWRARLLREQEPLSAARDVIAAIRFTQKAAEAKGTAVTVSADELRRLCVLAELILSDAGTSSSQHVEERIELQTEFDQLAAVVLPTRPVTENSATANRDFVRQLFDAYLLGRVFWKSTSTSTPPADLKEVAQQATAILSTMPPNASTQTAPKNDAQAELQRLTIRADAILRCIRILASIRRLEAETATGEDRRILASLAENHRDWLATILQNQILGTTDKPEPGDRALASFVLTLITAKPTTPSSVSAADTAQTLERQLDQLPVVLSLTAIAEQPAIANVYLQKLTSQPLTEAQTQKLATTLAESGSPSGIGVAGLGRDFWLKLQKQSRPGQTVWFEASLQLAILEHNAGAKKEALRILGVVEVLHPEWGNAQRKQRAAALRAELEKTR
ncbi:MAG: hypothetical protein JNM43_29260 [Planctomycetaceae bacterium]|nr:hypothetical protein [Planctomycetaceae bacterium]